jgi:hypothetical protein
MLMAISKLANMKALQRQVTGIAGSIQTAIVDGSIDASAQNT